MAKTAFDVPAAAQTVSKRQRITVEIRDDRLTVAEGRDVADGENSGRANEIGVRADDRLTNTARDLSFIQAVRA